MQFKDVDRQAITEKRSQYLSRQGSGLTAKRLTREYGSVKEALRYCVDLGLKLYGTAQQLECSTTFVIAWEKITGINIPRGVKGGQKGHNGNPDAKSLTAINAQRHQAKLKRLYGRR